ncbi:MAG: carbohydrate ABC transporter permease [Oligoflexus sp.]
MLPSEAISNKEAAQEALISEIKLENQGVFYAWRRFWKMQQRYWGIYLTLAIAAIILNIPFYYMIITAFKSNAELAQLEISFGLQNPTLDPMRNLLAGSSYLKSAWNSVIVAGLSTIGNILFCTMAGYAFAKQNFPGRDRIFFLLLSTMMIPGSVLLVPGFLLVRDLGWINTYLPLIIPGLGSIFFVFLARQFIMKIPDVILQAARLDGCSEFRIFFQIVFPLCRPLIATIGILSFLGSWNSFIGPMVYLFDEQTYTLPLVISMLQGRFSGQENILMAGALLSIVPVLVIFFALQKQIIDSFANSGLKE